MRRYCAWDPTGGHLPKFRAEHALVEVRAGQAKRQQIAHLGLTRQLPCSLQCTQQSRTQVAKIQSDEFNATPAPSRCVPRSRKARPAHLHLREVELAQLVLRRTEPHDVLRSVGQVRDDPTGMQSVDRSDRPPMLLGVPAEESLGLLGYDHSDG